MKFIISPEKMKQLMETADDTICTFVSCDKDKEIVQDIALMESMGVRQIELDLSSDEDSILH